MFKVVSSAATLPFNIVYHGSSAGDSLTSPAFTGRTALWQLKGTGLSTLKSTLGGVAAGGTLLLRRAHHEPEGRGRTSSVFAITSGASFNGLVDAGAGSIGKLVFNDNDTHTHLTAVLSGPERRVAAAAQRSEPHQLLRTSSRSPRCRRRWTRRSRRPRPRAR